jgi:thiamine kinase-like enzyme
MINKNIAPHHDLQCGNFVLNEGTQIILWGDK